MNGNWSQQIRQASRLSTESTGRILLSLFIVSGFAGLIYQSVWSQYLGLTLGHAAYAQTLVLSIFMGGMALGSWFVSRRTTSWRRLIMGYGLVELLIGVVGLSFQGIFQAYTRLSQESVLPFLESETIAHAYQWISAALLILPQSLLLGATFPLLSAGYLRLAPRQDGEVLGGLYFTNSLGAALGALAATFLILPLVGLPGTVMTAACLNILVGLGAWLVSNRTGEGAPAQTPASSMPTSSAPNTENAEVRRLGRIMLIATAISGGTSFVYELGWVRMLNQALGSSLHSFELMLTAFILGLAFGGLWIRRRSSRIDDPIRYVGYAQVLMGIAALFSIPVFALSFHWVGWIMEGLAKTDNGYTLFELGTAAISLAVMFPAAFFAGMTLPLFTMALLRAGADERAIGRIYAANTLGSILGVMLMVHALIPVMGIKLGLTLAALIDAILGIYLLRTLSPARLTPGLAAAVLSLLAAAGISMSLGKVDPVVQASGVFRTGNVRLGDDKTVSFLRDGKTATVAVISDKNNTYAYASIVTNGKPDAAMTAFDRPPSEDEATMVMLGLMPLAAHPAPRDVALIGWGSGLSTHTVLGSSVPQNVETIEIEKTMVDAARVFGPRVARAYDDPRSRLRIDDARTFFSVGNRRYDAIVSEPSNPWVSGVANLFTVEFYRFLKRHLKDDGVLVQWLHAYELSDLLLATMLSALIREFPNAEIYAINRGDLLILAPKGELSRPFQEAPWRETALAAELTRVGLGSLDEVVSHRIGGGEVIRQYVRLFDAKVHSDYFPEVSLNAPRTRFKNQQADLLFELLASGLPVLDILDCRAPLPAERQISPNEINSRRDMALRVEDALRESSLSAESRKNLPARDAQNIGDALFVLWQTSAIDTPEQVRAWSLALSTLAEAVIGALPAEDLRETWKPAPAWLPAGVLRAPLAAALMRTYAATAARDPQAMLKEAEAILAMPEAENLAPQTREHLLVIAGLGAMGVGDNARLADLERDHGKNTMTRFESARSYLLAWAGSGIPACVSRSPSLK
jgi:predicted membrane-bound spermidine synthase